MFYYLAIGLIAKLSGVNFCALFFVTNTIAFSSTSSTGKVSITLRTVTLGISKSVESPTLIPYHFVHLPFWERVIFCTWDIFHAIIVTNSSYRTVACKVVQRSLGKSPAKSFVQELSLWKKYHKHNIEELIIPKRKQLFFSEQQHYSNYYYYYYLNYSNLLCACTGKNDLFFSWIKITLFACKAVCWLQPNQIAV